MFEPKQATNDQSHIVLRPVCVSVLLWLVVLGAAFVVYMLTGNPLYASAIPYVHTILKPLRCGFWLWCVDPSAIRGFTHFWLYLALAFWMAAGSATAMVFLLLVTHKNGAPPPPIGFTMSVLAGGMGIGLIATFIAVSLALFSRTKVWADPRLHDRCAGDFQKLPLIHFGYNFTFWLIMPSMIIPALLIGGGILARMGGNGPNNPTPGSFVVGILVLFIAPWVMVAAAGFVCMRIAARNPAECWGDTLDEVSFGREQQRGR